MSATPQLFDASGKPLSEDQVKAILGRSNARSFEVRVNDGDDERKFGDATVFKVAGNGYRQPKMGVFKEAIPELITQLQEAHATLTAEDEEG